MGFEMAPIECSICLEEYNDTTRRPKVLPCGHNFHEHCLQDWIDTNGGNICSICRMEHKVTAVKDIPINTDLEKSIMSLKAVNTDNSDESNDGEVDFKCMTHGIYLGGECTKCDVTEIEEEDKKTKDDTLVKAQHTLTHLVSETATLSTIVEERNDSITDKKAHIECLEKEIDEDCKARDHADKEIVQNKGIKMTIQGCVERLQKAKTKTRINKECSRIQNIIGNVGNLFEEQKEKLETKECSNSSLKESIGAEIISGINVTTPLAAESVAPPPLPECNTKKQFTAPLRSSKNQLKWLLSLLFIASVITVGVSNDISEDCIVRKDINSQVNSRDAFTWIGFFGRDTSLKIAVAFVEKEEVSDNDVIEFKGNEVHKSKTRDRQIFQDGFPSDISLPLGWCKISVEIVNNDLKITIDSQQIFYELDYSIRFISIVSENMAVCTKGKPTWKITEEKYSSIPILGLYNIHFSLSSNKIFSPVIYMNEYAFHLQYASGVEIGHGNSSLPKGTYKFLLKIETDRWTLYFKEGEMVNKVILEMQFTDHQSHIRVDSMHEDFLLELTPTNWEDMKDSASSSTNLGLIIIGLIIVLATLSITLICIFIYKKCKPNERSNGQSDLSINSSESISITLEDETESHPPQVTDKMLKENQSKYSA